MELLFPELNLPANISEHGGQVDLLIRLVQYFMYLLFTGWGIFMTYCLFNFRARPGHKATYEPIKAKASKYIEIAVVTFEVALLLLISMPVWSNLKGTAADPPAGSFNVRVVAQQFAWNFHYPGADGVFGRTNEDLVEEALNPIGLDENDPAAADDFYTINQFHFPVGRDIQLFITSKDVIHSFFIPIARVKHDAIPGMEFPVTFKVPEFPEGTEPNEAGSLEIKSEIACAQLCGLSHFKMKGYITVQTAEDFAAWAEEQGADEEFDDDFEFED